ncbi:dipeptide/oligopeptide/nickel ABC transporter permease/ATP-binding protein [Streptomyces poriferorum]|uniref:Dipeptide/oligopeptide/nickel ABC transporter permease/ATP-binding protein n=2 Tax=Streptomyces poriferorum TaxID=2798799 RepID=A0ABY9IYR1_9ACTN|nr:MULTISPECIES: dipeptide/oligopeptide/nickel ABC transporter permease/ATP-binding protein [unclassified Streptomyces]MDP5310169.1 dipeptide/oligopeptide/nickel ABC transporter permease/ATP-binding protein [Streptomyces sp. Alt4]WLQ46755.1 dipeptide/oligopeptide/nickel ABC transporter permease/ATP-binding protein [Streptomyces sp. Alt1]WLQ60667.1 dipeptide/oligopeptide/nickel ABC transporter permease/ATP-binding protein [Streptomyces sp. Alt2]
MCLPSGFRRSPIAWATAFMLASLVALAVAGPMVWGAAADRPDPSVVLRGPSAAHPFGTDGLGRDLLARVLTATRPSLLLALAAVLLGAGSGIIVGSCTAVLGRRGRRLTAGMINLLLAFPALLVAMFLAVVFGAGTAGAVLALAAAGVPGFARLAQTLAAGVAGTDHLAAARVLGLRRHRLLWRHVLPNIAEPLLLSATTAAGTTLVALSGLSFLGLGVQPPGYDWGLLLSQGLDRIYAEPLPALAPGLAVLYAALAFQLLGEALAGSVARRGPAPRAPAPTPPPSGPAEDGLVLQVEDLTVELPTPGGTIQPVRGVSLSLRPGEAVGLVGESGSGKTLTALALADLHPHGARVSRRTLRLLGADLAALTPKERDRHLATGLSMIFQNPASALNPSLRIGTQLTEAVRAHRGTSRAQATAEAADALRRVALSPALLRSRPYQLSGGQRQRVMIAAGLMTRPGLIIADEPTTALDVTVQRQITRLLTDIRRDTSAALLFISHDIALVGEFCERVLVMYAGTIVEAVPADRLADGARHPYTRALVASVPDLAADRGRPLPTIGGGPPDPLVPAPGCPFEPRCPRRQDHCAEQAPPWQDFDATHRVACWHPEPVTAVLKTVARS